MSAVHCRAVIVDDEPWIREGLSEHIGWEELGIELVNVFEDGTEAVKYMQQHPVDILLSDIRMPRMTGLELVAKLREADEQQGAASGAKIIFLSGYGDFFYAQEALRLGAFDYLLKPVESEQVEEVLRRAKRLIGGAAPKPERRTELSSAAASAKSAKSGEPSSYLVKKALAIIDAKFTEELHLSQIAEELQVTSNYLSRLFRQETGQSFSDYISQLRLEKACHLLCSGTMKIYQVGEAVGCSNPRYFSEWFQKQTGMSPGDYRSRHA